MKLPSKVLTPFLYLSLPVLVLLVVSPMVSPSPPLINPWRPRKPFTFASRYLKSPFDAATRLASCATPFEPGTVVHHNQILLIALNALFVFYFSLRHWEGEWNSHYWMEVSNSMAFASLYNLAFFLIPVTPFTPVLRALNVTEQVALAFHRLAGTMSIVLASAHGFVHFLRFLKDDTEVKPGWLQWSLFPPCQPGEENDYDCDDCSCYHLVRNATGAWPVLMWIALGLLSAPKIRRERYQLFFISHVVLASASLYTLR